MEDNTTTLPNGLKIRNHANLNPDDYRLIHPEADNIINLYEEIAKTMIPEQETVLMEKRVTESYCGIVEIARTNLSEEMANKLVDNLKNMVSEFYSSYKILLDFISKQQKSSTPITPVEPSADEIRQAWESITPDVLMECFMSSLEKNIH